MSTPRGGRRASWAPGVARPVPGPGPTPGARRVRRQSATVPSQQALAYVQDKAGGGEDGGVATTEDFLVLQDALAHLRRTRQGLLSEIKASHSTIERLQVENTKLNLLLEGSLAQQRELRSKLAEEADTARRLRAEASRAAREAEIKAAERWETERARMVEEQHDAISRLESSFEERVASVRDAVAEQWAERVRLARQASATREAELRRKLQEQAAASDSAMRAAEERAEKDQEALRERLRGHVLAEVEGAAETFAGLYKKAAAHVREKMRVRSWDDRVKQLMDEKEDLQRQLAMRDEEMEAMRRERGRAREVEFAALEEFLWRRTGQATKMRREHLYCLQVLARDNAALLARLVGSRRRAVDLGARPPPASARRLPALPPRAPGGGLLPRPGHQEAEEGEGGGGEEKKEPVFHAPPAMRLYAPAPLYAELRRTAPALADALPLPAGVREALGRLAEASRRTAASGNSHQTGVGRPSERSLHQPGADGSDGDAAASASLDGYGHTPPAVEATPPAHASDGASAAAAVSDGNGDGDRSRPVSGRRGSEAGLAPGSAWSDGAEGPPAPRPRASSMPEPPSVRQAVSPGRVLSAAGLGRRTYQSPTRAESRASLVGRTPRVGPAPDTPAGASRDSGGEGGGQDNAPGHAVEDATSALPPPARAAGSESPASSQRASAGARPLARALEAAMLSPSPSGRAWGSATHYAGPTAVSSGQGAAKEEGEEEEVDDSSSSISASSILLTTAASLFASQGRHPQPPADSEDEDEDEDDIRPLLRRQRSLGHSVDRAAELAASRVVFGEWVACPRPNGAPPFYANVRTGDLVSSGVEGAGPGGEAGTVPERPQWRTWLMHSLMSSGEEGRALAVAFDAAGEGEGEGASAAVPRLRLDAELAPEGVPTLRDLMANARGNRVLAPLGASSSDQRSMLGTHAWWRGAEGHDRLHAAAAVKADEAVARAGTEAEEEAAEMLRHARRDALDVEEDSRDDAAPQKQ